MLKYSLAVRHDSSGLWGGLHSASQGSWCSRETVPPLHSIRPIQLTAISLLFLMHMLTTCTNAVGKRSKQGFFPQKKRHSSPMQEVTKSPTQQKSMMVFS